MEDETKEESKLETRLRYLIHFRSEKMFGCELMRRDGGKGGTVRGDGNEEARAVVGDE